MESKFESKLNNSKLNERNLENKESEKKNEEEIDSKKSKKKISTSPKRENEDYKKKPSVSKESEKKKEEEIPSKKLITKNATSPKRKNEVFKKISSMSHSEKVFKYRSLTLKSENDKRSFKVPFRKDNETAEIEDQEIKISHANNNYFLYVKQNSEFVYLCAEKFNIIPDSIFIIGHNIIKAYNKNENIILAKPEFFDISLETGNDLSCWIVREQNNSTLSIIGKKPSREIVSCSDQLIKKRIFTKNINSEGYYFPIKIENGMKLCFKNKIYKVKVKDNN